MQAHRNSRWCCRVDAPLPLPVVCCPLYNSCLLFRCHYDGRIHVKLSQTELVQPRCRHRFARAHAEAENAAPAESVAESSGIAGEISTTIPPAIPTVSTTAVPQYAEATLTPPLNAASTVDSAEAQQPLASISGKAATLFQQEFLDLGQLAFPLAAQNVIGYSMTIISSIFIGRLGAQQLSSYVLASSFYNVTGLSVVLGLCGGMDTLCGQVRGTAEVQVLVSLLM